MFHRVFRLRSDGVPEIQAFSAIRYDVERFGRDWSAVIAPPYDVLDASDKDRLLVGSRYNIVAVDLPVAPAREAGRPEVYEEAGRTLREWLAAGVLRRDPAPGLYICHQMCEVAGQQLTRRMLLTVMRIEEFAKGVVIPHERTYAGPKEDRLRLMRATRCQLSPVFGLYGDPSNSVAAATDPGERPPDVTASLDGVTHRLWAETDAASIAHVRMLLDGARVYIADGHHRYLTAMSYRDELAAAAGGRLPPDHPAQFVLVGLCAMEDPGCVILPTHRVLSGMGPVSAADLTRLWAAGCSFSKAPSASVETLVSPDAGHDVAICDGAEEGFYVGTFTDRGILARLAPERSDAWRKLDLAYLHRYLIDELLTRKVLAGTPPTIRYTPSAEEAQRLARESRGVAVLVKPTQLSQLRAVADAGDLMPPKSTYFYPKLATGLVIYPLWSGSGDGRA